MLAMRRLNLVPQNLSGRLQGELPSLAAIRLPAILRTVLSTSFFLLVLVNCCLVHAYESGSRTTLWDKSTNEGYRLAVLEFTERGNLANRALFTQLKKELATIDKSLVAVFIHGWKHSAAPDDSNLQSFRRMLTMLRQARVVAKSREIVGVYLGWPGVSVQLPFLEEATFWGRKAVAQEVGKGGVTEVLVALENIQTAAGKDRMMVTIGHSFGGAIVASALSEVLLSRVIDAKPDSNCSLSGEDQCTEPCVLARNFGDAVVLINPAIEANEVLPLKSLVAERCFPPNQPKLLHVLSTDADVATNRYFPLGQTLSMLMWNEEPALYHSFRGKEILLNEHQLDTITVGNYSPYWTGRLFSDKTGYKYCSLAIGNAKKCPGVPEDIQSIPTASFEPLSFISTGKEFMNDHNDIFNTQVIAYLATIVREALTVKEMTGRNKYSIDCYGIKMSFGECFAKNVELMSYESK